MLTYAVTASLKDSPAGRRSHAARERIMRQIGVPDAEWSIGYGRTYQLDGLKLYANWGGATFTPRAAARVGQLMMLPGSGWVAN